ncbi:MAG: twin-arginine translocase TatA/TatE family subunit [Bacteroidales bacterium]|nr:twin-arginine translocase TatA/TatE family subunit [Bacteroidales bacterium]
MIGTWEIIVIVLVVLLLFGGKKIPELMHGVGKGVKSFKDGMNGLEGPSDPKGLNGNQQSDPKGLNSSQESNTKEQDK